MRLVMVVTMLEEKTTSNRLRWGQLLLSKHHRSLTGATMSIESAIMSPIIRGKKKEEAGSCEHRGVLMS